MLTSHRIAMSKATKGGKNVVMASHGRAPWYGPDGHNVPAYVIGIAGGSASGKVSAAEYPSQGRTEWAKQVIRVKGSGLCVISNL
jgi:hypothetical protein